MSTMHILKGQNHLPCTINLPLSQQVKDLDAHGKNAFAFDHTLCCIQFFSTEKKVHGKFHVWRAQNVDSSVTSMFSLWSRFIMKEVNMLEGRYIFQPFNFLESTGSLPPPLRFDVRHNPADSYLHFANTSLPNVTTVIPFEFLSVPF